MVTVSNKNRFSAIAVLISRLTARTRNLALCAIILCGLIVNANTLFNDFVYDDHVQIMNNPWITNIKHIPEIFSTDAVYTGNGQASNYYRPIVRIICMMNYYVFGGIHSWAFHLVNIIFHVGISIILFFMTSLLVRSVTSEPDNHFFSFPFVSALVFSLHPIHADVVAWAGGVSELSFTFFCMLSLYFYMGTLHAFDRKHVLALVFFGLSIFTKETAVTLLPILACYDALFRTDKMATRRTIMRYAPFGAILGMYLVIRFNILGGMAPVSRHPELNTFEVIINVIPLFSQYLEKLLIPINLNVFYVLHPVHSITELRWLFSLVIVIIFGLLGYVFHKKNKSALLGFVIITIPLLPALYIRGVGEDTFADRYLYFPTIGFAIIAGSIISSEAIAGKSRRKLLSILLWAVLGVYAIGTIHRNMVWKNDLSLWSDSVQKSPDSYFVQQWVGAALLNDRRYGESIGHLKTALQLNPTYELTYISLAEAYAISGQRDESLRVLHACVAASPKPSNCHNNIGALLFENNLLKEAIEEFQLAIQLNPSLTTAYNGLYQAYALLGMQDKSLEYYKKGLLIITK